jgi:uncharacterized membrane protein
MRSVARRVQNLWPEARFGWAIVLVLGVFLLVPADLGLKTRLLTGWTVGVGYYMTTLVVVMRQATAEQTRDRSQHHQVSRTGIFALVMTVAWVILFAIGLLLSTGKAMSPIIQMVYVGLSALSILGGWFLIHTTFAQQYAALYYRPDENNQEHPCGGLAFPNADHPTYWDFLYFSLVIGMTAQTSDTLILSRPIRRLALVQALIAFLFLVGILALCVNIGSDLLQAGQG